MPKQKASIIIDTFEGRDVDWGVIMRPGLREGLQTFQDEKKLRPIIQQYLTVLFPPRGLPAPETSRQTPRPRSAKRLLADLTTTEWEEEANPRVTEASPSQDDPQTNRAHSSEAQPTASQEEQEMTHGSPKPKHRRLDRKDGRGLVKDTTPRVEHSALAEATTTLELISEPRPIITAQSQCGKGVLTAEREVLSYLDIPDTAHEFGALLQFGTTYELMEFLVTQQIKVF